MKLAQTIPIVYGAGAYGTYLEWALCNLTSDSDVPNNITDTGSSHAYGGNLIEKWNPGSSAQKFYHRPEYDWSQGYPQFVRLHPKTLPTDSVDQTLLTLLDDVERIIYVYPDPGSVVLPINNMFFKIWKSWKSWWDFHVKYSIGSGAEVIHQNWPVIPGTPVDQIPIWIRREFLSYYLISSWLDQVEWYHLDRWRHPRCHVVLIHDLLYDFNRTMNDIQKFCNLDFKKPPHTLMSIHADNISKQKYLTQDQLCHQIVDTTMRQVEFDWKDRLLPLPSQAWIQWQFRNYGYEMKCHGLDIFPTSSVQLRELLYSI
jgi:hypothetical protein